MGDESQASLIQHRRELHGIRDDRTRVVLRESAEQRRHLDSVSSRIGAAIVEFMQTHHGLTFFADDLRRHVVAKVGVVAPGSADRILRDLKQRGVVSYSVVNRAQSLYVCGDKQK